MNMFEAFGPGDAKALEQRKDNQRRQTLRRRRRIVERARLRRDAERLIDNRAIAFHVSACDWAPDAIEIGRDLAPDVAAVKIVKPGMGKLLKRRGKRCLLQPRAGLGDFAIEQKCMS